MEEGKELVQYLITFTFLSICIFLCIKCNFFMKNIIIDTEVSALHSQDIGASSQVVTDYVKGVGASCEWVLTNSLM